MTPSTDALWREIEADLRLLAAKTRVPYETMHGTRQLATLRERFEAVEQAFDTEVRVCRARTKMLHVAEARVRALLEAHHSCGCATCETVRAAMWALEHEELR